MAVDARSVAERATAEAKAQADADARDLKAAAKNRAPRRKLFSRAGKDDAPDTGAERAEKEAADAQAELLKQQQELATLASAQDKKASKSSREEQQALSRRLATQELVTEARRARLAGANIVVAATAAEHVPVEAAKPVDVEEAAPAATATGTDTFRVIRYEDWGLPEDLPPLY